MAQYQIKLPKPLDEELKSLVTEINAEEDPKDPEFKVHTAESIATEAVASFLASRRLRNFFPTEEAL